MNELWRKTASELARLISSKKVSSEEVIETHLARIEAVNPKVNAVVRVLASEARAAALEADRRTAAGGPLGQLHGVPFTVKENIDMAGLPTTWGVPAAGRRRRAAGRAGRAADARSRCDPHWAHQPARHGAARQHGQLVVRHHAQPLERAAHGGRLKRERGRGAGHRNEPDRLGQR